MLLFRARGLAHILYAQAAILAAVGVWGKTATDAPRLLDSSAEAEPIAVLAALPLACLIVLSLASRMGSFELAAARPLHWVDAAQLGVLTLATTAGLLAALFAGGGLELAPEALRNLMWWIGVSCLSGAFMGRALAWPLPLAVLVLVYVFGTLGEGGLQAWAVPRLPAERGYTWAVSAVLMAVGTTLLIRRTALTRWWSRGPSLGVPPRSPAVRSAPRGR